jgi:biopolymer transport protein ExbB/biopolymer transport protein TolQ
MLVLPLLAQVALAADEAAPGFTMVEIWEHSGGIARAVIFTLALMLVAALVVAVERLWYLNGNRKRSMAAAQQVVGPLQKGDIGGALKVVSGEEFKSTYLASVLAAGLKELNTRLDEHGIRAAERAFDKSTAEELSKCRRGMSILATVGSTAPFVGLFGTTFGVINAFQGMAVAGSGLASISAGISEALITTGVGIGVAVLGVWFFNYFNGRTEKVAEELASAHADFIDWAEKAHIAQEETDHGAGK